MKPLNTGKTFATPYLERRGVVERLIAEDMAQASSLQASLLPTPIEISRIRQLFPLEVASYFRPSESIGGDIWGLKAIGESKLRLFHADFSGHGASAALDTFILHAFVESGELEGEDPALWLGQINRHLCSMLPRGQFATMFAAVVDFAEAALIYACASSPANLVYNPGAGYHPIDGRGYPLGIVPNAAFESHVLPFPPGSALLVYSDALVETPAPPDAIFSVETLCAFMNDRIAAPLDEIAQNLACALCPDKSSALLDDFTLALFRHLERDAPAKAG